MANDLTALIGRVGELNGRATEISNRICQDARLLAEVQRELSVVLSKIWGVCDETLSSPPSRPVPATLGPRILRIQEVTQRVGLGRSSLWRMVKEGHFPAPCRLGSRAVGWRDIEVDEWVRRREAAS